MTDYFKWAKLRDHVEYLALSMENAGKRIRDEQDRRECQCYLEAYKNVLVKMSELETR